METLQQETLQYADKSVESNMVKTKQRECKPRWQR